MKVIPGYFLPVNVRGYVKKKEKVAFNRHDNEINL